MHHEAKKVINLSTGEIFGSLKSAAEKYNINYNTLTNHLQGKTKTCCGCIWDYLQNVNLDNFKPLNNVDTKKLTQKRIIYVQELDKYFTSLSSAAKELQCSPSLISIQIKKSQKNNEEYGIAKGYHIKYVQTIPCQA